MIIDEKQFSFPSFNGDQLSDVLHMFKILKAFCHFFIIYERIVTDNYTLNCFILSRRQWQRFNLKMIDEQSSLFSTLIMKPKIFSYKMVTKYVNKV